MKNCRIAWFLPRITWHFRISSLYFLLSLFFSPFLSIWWKNDLGKRGINAFAQKAPQSCDHLFSQFFFDLSLVVVIIHRTRHLPISFDWIRVAFGDFLIVSKISLPRAVYLWISTFTFFYFFYSSSSFSFSRFFLLFVCV